MVWSGVEWTGEGVLWCVVEECRGMEWTGEEVLWCVVEWSGIH